MTSLETATVIVFSSMLISLGAYIRLSLWEGTYINILTPLYLIQVPANFLLQIVYMVLFGTEYTTYAYLYVYGTIAVSNWAFVLAYTRRRKMDPPSHVYAYRNFAALSWVCLLLSGAIYAPVLLEFREFLLDPRQIYILTRTGYGQETFVSSTLAYLAMIFVLFSNRPRRTKAFVLIASSVLLLLHGSKVQVLNVPLLVLLFQVYVARKKITLLPAFGRALAVSLVVLILFAATLPLGGGAFDAVQEISEYSDYTRNAMLVIDSHVPLQYGRLTVGANVYGIIPRILMPSKPKDFGTFYLAELFFPEWFDADTGSPDFGIGVQYADFGALALVYLAIFAILNGWLASLFVERLRLTRHPSDFFLVIFLAGIAVMPLGGAGWLLPEAIILAACMRYASCIGSNRVVRIVRTDQSAMTRVQT